MLLAKIDHSLHERQKVTVRGLQIPVQPTNFVVLAVGIVVSHLRVPDGISRIHHGYALGEQQRCQQIPFLLGAQSLNVGVVGRTLDPAIPAPVIVVAVAIIFAIRFVMFVVVADQIL